MVPPLHDCDLDILKREADAARWMLKAGITKRAKQMTLPPEKIGDKGQRFQIKYSRAVDAMDDEHILGYAGTLDGAERMAEAWRKHPDAYFVWIVDRAAPVVNEASS